MTLLPGMNVKPSSEMEIFVPPEMAGRLPDDDFQAETVSRKTSFFLNSIPIGQIWGGRKESPDGIIAIIQEKLNILVKIIAVMNLL